MSETGPILRSESGDASARNDSNERDEEGQSASVSRSGMLRIEHDAQTIYFKWPGQVGGTIIVKKGKVELIEGTPPISAQYFDQLFRTSLGDIRALVNLIKESGEDAWRLLLNGFRKWELQIQYPSEESDSPSVLSTPKGFQLQTAPISGEEEGSLLSPLTSLWFGSSNENKDHYTFKGVAQKGCTAIIVVRSLNRVPLISQLLLFHTAIQYRNPDGQTWTSSFYHDGRVREDNPTQRERYKPFLREDLTEEDVALYRHDSYFDGVIAQRAERIIEQLYDCHRFPHLYRYSYSLLGRNCHDYVRDVCRIYCFLERGMQIPEEYDAISSHLIAF